MREGRRETPAERERRMVWVAICIALIVVIPFCGALAIFGTIYWEIFSAWGN